MKVAGRNRHVLAVIAGLLLVSGTARFVIGIGPAIAFAEELEPMVEAPPSDQDLAVEPLLAALLARENRVAERETAIDDRLLALSLAEAELNERLADLEAAEASLTAALVLSETVNDDDIARLTSVFENMKPADAAALFEEMAPDFAAGFLVRMQPELAAPILAGLDSGTAYSISVIIAGRNANAPTE